MKRQVAKTEYNFISNELKYHKNEGIITEEQEMRMLDAYDIKEGLNFIKVVVTVGAVLVGLGVLSFIASNWDGMTKLIKLIIIFGLFTGVNLAGYFVSSNNPKTGRSLLYLGTLIYGAGIFLIGQMFNLGGNFATAFLLWSVGIIPMAYQQKDKFILLFANVLFLVYLNGMQDKEFPWAFLIVIPVLYYSVQFFTKSRLLLFFANLSSLNVILHLAIRYDLKGLYIAIAFFIIGLLMYFVKHDYHQYIFKIQGNLLLGGTGVLLTLPEAWSEIIKTHSMQVSVSATFAVLFIILLLALVRTGSIISLILICVTIFRYYIDTFQFLPKSLFFIVGGLLLLAFGYYFERMRKLQKGEE